MSPSTTDTTWTCVTRRTVEHLYETTDFLVRDLGVGYFKLDYNIHPDPGTDVGG